MGFEIVISSMAQIEIDEAAEYYALNSIDAPINFLSEIKDAYRILEINPFFRIRYKIIRALNLKGLP